MNHFNKNIKIYDCDKIRKIRLINIFFILSKRNKMSQSYDLYKYISEYATSIVSMSVID